MAKPQNLFLLLIVIAAFFLSPVQSFAGGQTTVSTIYHADMIILGNPDGAALELGVNRKRTGEPDGAGDESPYFQYGASLGLNPSYAQIGVNSEWMPYPFAILRLQYDYYIFSGDNGFLTSFPSGDAAFGDEELEALEGEEESATGQRIMLKPTLRAKMGPVLVMNETGISYFLLNGDGPFFREGQYDTLIKDGDIIIENTLMFPVELSRTGKDAVLFSGPFFQVTYAKEADLTRQRTGLVAYWIPRDRLWRVDRPRVYSMLGYNLQDRNRDDEFFFILGTGFDLDR